MRLFVLTLLFSITLPVFAVDNVIVRQSTGDTSYFISKISHISFPTDGSGIVLNFTDGTSKTFARGKYVSIRFNANLSGLEMVGSNNQTAILYNAETAEVSVVGMESKIEIYASNGMLVAKGENTVNISHVETGVYVVKAGVLTAKIMK